MIEVHAEWTRNNWHDRGNLESLEYISGLRIVFARKNIWKSVDWTALNTLLMSFRNLRHVRIVFFEKSADDMEEFEKQGMPLLAELRNKLPEGGLDYTQGD